MITWSEMRSLRILTVHVLEENDVFTGDKVREMLNRGLSVLAQDWLLPGNGC